MGGTPIPCIDIAAQFVEERLGHRQGDFPVTGAWAAQILTLPVSQSLGSDAIGRVAAAVNEFFRDGADEVGYRSPGVQLA